MEQERLERIKYKMKHSHVFLDLSNRPLLSAKMLSCMLVLSLFYRNLSTSILFVVLKGRILVENLCVGGLNFLLQSLGYISFSVKQADFFFF